MEILNIYPNPERSEWAALTERCTRQEEEITRQVASILDEVRTGGDRALRAITRRIEGRDCETFEVPADIRRAAAELVPAALKEALATAKANIEAFHRAQLPPEVSVEPMPGVRCVQRALPIRRVGLYIPGGKAPLFSTVLMLSIIQGLYILREDEGEELEKRRNKKKRNQQKNDPGAKKKRRPDEETERRKKSGSRNDGQGTRQKYREQPDEFERRIEEQTENSLHW